MDALSNLKEVLAENCAVRLIANRIDEMHVCFLCIVTVICVNISLPEIPSSIPIVAASFT